MPREHLHFVTGRLAEFALREQVANIAAERGFEYSISVLGISVAALMTTSWVARQLKAPGGVSQIILPGFCTGDLRPVEDVTGITVVRGPKDLRELAEYFGLTGQMKQDGSYEIEILAEINHAPRLPLAEILCQADQLKRDGADVIDVGCDPTDRAGWTGVGEVVKALRDAGHRVSVDSMHVDEIALATAAGAELVLSVNSTNRHAAADWGVEVVAVPNDPTTLVDLDETVELLELRKVPFRIDPVLEPIGFGFAASLGRYLDVRRRWPKCAMLMGIGNLTELTDCDSAAVNVLLLGFCQEQGIRSVLTTQVINWARSSVRECDLARRLVYHSVRNRVLPKHLAPELVALRDPRVLPYGGEQLAQLGSQIKDPNYRLFAEDDQIHLMAAGIHLTDRDPFNLFRRLLALAPENLDTAHSFYLGYELAKAVTALTLSKQYRQDQALDWGFLTRAEPSHYAPKQATDADNSATD